MDELEENMGQWHLNSEVASPRELSVDGPVQPDAESQLAEIAPAVEVLADQPSPEILADPDFQHHVASSEPATASTSGSDEEDHLDLAALAPDEAEVDDSEMSEQDEGDDDSRFVQFDDANSDIGIADTFLGTCIDSCRPQWLAVHEKAQRRKQQLRIAYAQIRDLQTANRDKQRRINVLEAQIRVVVEGVRRRTEVTWPRKLRTWMTQGPNSLGPEIRTYECIYRLSCRESNMNPHPLKVHPGLELREMTSAEEQHMTDPSRGRSGPFLPVTPGLPLDIQARILHYALCFDGDIVHAISRLDPYFEPSLPPNGGDFRLLHRFHVGSAPVSLTCATMPNVLLAPLLVCKAWSFWGAHFFYSENTFAFSSLGELGRFCQGIGPRLQRVQHISLLFLGSQHLTYAKSARNKYVSRRTQPLMWLPEARRLKTITVFIQESSKIRRPHETRGIIRYLTKKTQHQPNYRQFRSLRTLQGLDYIHCLRGIKSIEFLDYDQWLTSKVKAPVRDSTFSLDVSTTVRLPKEDVALQKSRLRRLAPLIRRYDAPETVWRSLQTVCQEYCQSSRPTQGVIWSPNSSKNGSHSSFPAEQEVINLESDSDSDSDSDCSTTSSSDTDSRPDARSISTDGASFSNSAAELQEHKPHLTSESQSKLGSASQIDLFTNSDDSSDSEPDGSSDDATLRISFDFENRGVDFNEPDSDTSSESPRSSPEVIDLSSDDEDEKGSAAASSCGTSQTMQHFDYEQRGPHDGSAHRSKSGSRDSSESSLFIRDDEDVIMLDGPPLASAVTSPQLSEGRLTIGSSNGRSNGNSSAAQSSSIFASPTPYQAIAGRAPSTSDGGRRSNGNYVDLTNDDDERTESTMGAPSSRGTPRPRSRSHLASDGE